MNYLTEEYRIESEHTGQKYMSHISSFLVDHLSCWNHEVTAQIVQRAGNPSGSEDTTLSF